MVVLSTGSFDSVVGMAVSAKNQVVSLARSLGAELVGVDAADGYGEYLAEVRARTAHTGARLEDYMVAPSDTSFFERLSEPRRTLQHARAVVIVGVGAYDKNAVYTDTRQALRGKVARTYACYPVVRQIAERLADFIRRRGYEAVAGQDVPLKLAAHRIGLGRYGRNGLLLTETCGSYVGLRSVVTEMPLAPDRFEKSNPGCGDCRACLRACPTGALYAPYKVNPRLCINPLTRREQDIPPELRLKMQNWICGCDICQEVCPVNKGLVVRDVDARSGFDSRHHASHRYLDDLDRTPLLTELLRPQYPELIRRNASIALANIGKGRGEALDALKGALAGATGRLRRYYLWALRTLEEG